MHLVANIQALCVQRRAGGSNIGLAWRIEMCGIAGAFNFDLDARAADVTVVARLNELQRRRGPDGNGLWSSADGRLALGHRRLAIIDTGPHGAQPMSDATG